MAVKAVRIDVNKDQIVRIREEVFANPNLSVEGRRRALRKILPIPADGRRVDVYCEGDCIGAV